MFHVNLNSLQKALTKANSEKSEAFRVLMNNRLEDRDSFLAALRKYEQTIVAHSVAKDAYDRAETIIKTETQHHPGWKGTAPDE